MKTRLALAPLLLLASLPLPTTASAQPGSCYCNVINLTRCGGAGPTLLYSYLYADPGQGSQWFFAAMADEPRACAAYDRLPYDRIAFNYYGGVVTECPMMMMNCTFVP